MLTRKKKIAVSIVVLADLLTKLAALLFLRFEESVILTRDFYFELTYNRSGTNSVIQMLGFKTSQIIPISLLLGLVFGLEFLLCNMFIKRRLYRLLVYGGSFLLFYLGLNILLLKNEFIEFGSLNDYWSTFLRFIGPLFLFSIVFYFSKDKIYIFVWSLYIGAGFGNTLSLFYPPFRVVDFMYSQLLNSMLGTGIFNVADVFLDVSVFAFVTYTPIYLIRNTVALIYRVTKKKRLRKAKEEPAVIEA